MMAVVYGICTTSMRIPKNCFPVFDPCWKDKDLVSVSDLLKEFPEGTKADVILGWVEKNGILEN